MDPMACNVFSRQKDGPRNGNVSVALPCPICRVTCLRSTRARKCFTCSGSAVVAIRSFGIGPRCLPQASPELPFAGGVANSVSFPLPALPVPHPVPDSLLGNGIGNGNGKDAHQLASCLFADGCLFFSL